MERTCFLCQTDPENIIVQQWELPGLESSQIGFSICPNCGLVLQHPALDRKKMLQYYSDIATYINPGRKGKPAPRKIRDVERLIDLTRHLLGKMPENALQVGCSDGYTLSAFKQAGVTEVLGLDPSTASHELAEKMYGIRTIVSSIEEFEIEKNSRPFEMIILTHILEHLYDPVAALDKCAKLQDGTGWVLIEVPLFENIDWFRPGMFSLEHVNYFSEETLLDTLTSTGYEALFVAKYFTVNFYPVITILARKNKDIPRRYSHDFDRAHPVFLDYIDREKNTWSRIERKIRERVGSEQKVYIYGAGIHTSQLLAFTSIKEDLNITGLMDSSPTKWGKKFGRWYCFNPDEVEIRPEDRIIISSLVSEQEIYKYLLDQGKAGKEQIVCLHHEQEA